MFKDWQPESEFLRAIDARQEAAIEARGKELGKELGKALGVRELLVRLLRQRFGSLPPEVAGRVEAAQLDELNLWTSRLLDARSLAEVFEGGSSA
ncbi:DUF4351 domain-containing protein [Myxococcota bacterium]|nr:DUF4351 domain-containing protein [Myxococcota bacterium]